MWGKSDYYAILGLDHSATFDQIRSAYRSLALRYHPDTAGEEHDPELFRQIHEAYLVLSDPERREAYDRWRAERGLDKGPRLRIAVTCSHDTLLALPDPQVLYVILDLSIDDSDEHSAVPLNLSLVLDRSTSMQGVRLQKVKEAACEIIDRLGPGDIFSVVAFSDRAEVIVPGRPGMDRVQGRVTINSIRAGGGTEIFQGLLAGMHQVNQWRSADYINHVILLTDGQTFGDEEQCLALAKEAGHRNVGITAVGIGSDWNDRLLDQIAELSGGTCSYLENPAQVAEFFRQKIMELASALAYRLSLVVRTAQGVEIQDVFRLAPILNRLQAQDGVYILGLMNPDVVQSVLLELIVPPMPMGHHRLASVEVAGLMARQLEDRQRISTDIVVEVAESSNPTKIPQRILAAMNRITIFRLQEKALSEAGQGQYLQASRRLEQVATRLLDIGEVQLARAALLEAGHLRKTGKMSLEGTKRIKYGTRSLSLDPGDIVEDAKDDQVPHVPGPTPA